MRRALFTVALTVCVGLASAHSRTDPAVSATDSSTRMTRQFAPEAVKVSAKNNEKQVRSLPQNSADEQSDPGKSGWRTYGTLMATLILMGAIALRRYKSGKP